MLVLIIIILIVNVAGCKKSEQIIQPPERADVNLVFYNWSNDSTFIDELSEKIKTKYDYITIEPQTVNWNSMHRTLEIKMASNQMPEIIDFKGKDVAFYARSNSFIELSNQKFMDNIDIESRENTRYRGKDYGLPYTIAYHGVIYNKDIFNAYHLEVPTTYDEFLNVCEILKNNGIIPFVTHYKDSGQIADIAMQLAIGELFEKDPSWGDKLLSGKRSFYDSEAYRFAFQGVKYIYENSIKESFSMNRVQCDTFFAEEKAAMICSGTWSLETIRQVNVDLNIGIFPMPLREGDSKLVKEVYHTFAGSAKSECVDDILNVLELIANDTELAQDYSQRSMTQSTLIAATPTETSLDNDIKYYLENQRVVDAIVGNSQITWEYQDAYCGYIAQWLFGEITLDEALIASDEYKNQVR